MTQSRPEAWEAIAAAARLRARLFEWMLQHHDRLAGPLADRRADWHSLAGALVAAGLTDPAGAPPPPETARRVWLRACRFVAARRRREAAALAGPAPPGAGPRAGAEATPGGAAPWELAPEDVALVGRQWGVRGGR